MGIARLVLAGLAVLFVLALVVVGAKALFNSLNAKGEEPTSPPVATSPNQNANAPQTLLIRCVAEICPAVFVRIPGGDILQNRDMSKGEEMGFIEPELDVVVGDAGTVEIQVNGQRRPPGEPGSKDTFSVRPGST
ncbi:hypothetical protein D5H75_16245 [Bailinhaonella thermotolerans]|uniref:DUF4115 domain-containing protein n=2 Tax=Bailinhaonella thermotolerans TaxID=1070861 RepID=A0A3A4ATQ1_9ACTN|nr:hypothetical protein D5H75_16245 [Bailinhaonella thermotolerans]